MEIHKAEIERITKLIRSLNKDEYEPPITTGVGFAEMEKELKHLAANVKYEKNKKQQIISHLTHCFIGNFFHEFPLSDRNDELDVISSGFNTYMEELEAKTVSRDYFQRIFNAIPHKVLVFDIFGKIDLINDEGNGFFDEDFSLEDDTHIYDVLPPELLANIDLFTNSNNEKNEFEVSISKTNHELIYLQCSLLKIKLDNKIHILLTANDVTEEKNEELKLLKATLYGQELERKRLAYDLHDSLGQELNAIKMFLNSISKMDSSSERYNKTMKDIHLMLNESINSVQDISFNLMPSILENNELSISVEQLVDRLNAVCHNISFASPKQPFGLKEKKDELFVYRIIQEFLNNSIKYSKAENITVELENDPKKNTIKVSLKDNGIGFDMNVKNLKNGIHTINQRLKTLKSTYQFTSQKNKGTELIFTIYNQE